MEFSLENFCRVPVPPTKFMQNHSVPYIRKFAGHILMLLASFLPLGFLVLGKKRPRKTRARNSGEI